MYGDLMMADGQYGGSKGRRWKVDWNRAPQPIQIKLKCLRGVKDKLPGTEQIVCTFRYEYQILSTRCEIIFYIHIVMEDEHWASCIKNYSQM